MADINADALQGCDEALTKATDPGTYRKRSSGCGDDFHLEIKASSGVGPRKGDGVNQFAYC